MPTKSTGDGRYAVPLWLNGEPQLPRNATLFPVRCAMSGFIVHYAVSATIADAEAACEASWSAFQSWKLSSPSHRRNILNGVADAFERRKDELVEVQFTETSCDEAWAANNVMISINYLREIAACVSSIMGQIPMNDKPETLSLVFKEPVGVVLTMPPWNAALVLATRALASAIGAGCTCVLKASELSPLTHQTILECFEEAGLPRGCINQVQVAREDAAQVTEALIANQRVRKVEFIGSAAVGRIIGSVAARHLKPVLMELGGKCPAIVLDDAYLPKAAKMCAMGALMHHGQICFSTERIIVQKTVAEEFQRLLIEAVQSHSTNGAAVSQSIAQHAKDVLQDAQANGSTFLVGNGDWDTSFEDNNTSLNPTIVLNPRGRITDEETFGPSASLYVVETDEQAIELANRSSYGLNATIHSSNMGRALKMARELEYGQVHVNSISVYTSPTGPQGGVKGSGWGRQNAGWGLSEFLQEKFITFHP